MRKSEDVTGVDLASMFSAFFLRFNRRPFGYFRCIKELITYLGANWPFSLFKIRGNNPLESTPPYSSSSDNRYLISEDLKAN